MERVILNHRAKTLRADVERGDLDIAVVVAVLQHAARLDHAGTGLVTVKSHMGVLFQALGSHLIDPVHLQVALHRNAAGLVRGDDLIELGVAALLDDQRDPAAVRARRPIRTGAGEEFAVNLRSVRDRIRIGVFAGCPILREVDLTAKGMGRFVVRRRRIGFGRRGAARESRRRGREIDEIAAAEGHRASKRRGARVGAACDFRHGERRIPPDRHRPRAGEGDRPDRHGRIERDRQGIAGVENTGVIPREGNRLHTPVRRGGELSVPARTRPRICRRGTRTDNGRQSRRKHTYSFHAARILSSKNLPVPSPNRP